MSDSTPVLADLQAENHALRQELARYKAIVDHSSQGMYIYHLEDHADDRSLRLVAANAAVEPLVGVERSVLIGNTLDANFSRAARKGIPQAFASVVRSGTPWQHENIYGDAHVIESAWQMRAVALPNDEVAIYFDNITQRKRAEHALQQLNNELEQRISERTQELQDQQALLQTLFNTLPIAVFVKAAADGRFVLWNPTSEAYFGLSAADVVGKTDFDLFPHEQASGFQRMDQAVLSGRSIAHIPEELIDTVHRGQRVLRTTKFPIYDSHDQPLYLLVISEDITEEKQAAEANAALQEEVIAAQQASLRELSTPLIPLSERILLLPLIGTVDSHRAQQMMETLLIGVAERRANLVILDITGVRVVDTQVANAFIRAAQAIRLLGAEVMLTGIGPEVAQTLVQLGVELHGLRTRGSLQSAIREAFQPTKAA